jgi:hypothetical protein
VQCGKYRISKPDSEGSRPQPGHAAVTESVSRDKSANAPLADRGSECLGCSSGGVTQPAARAGVPRSDSLRLILSEPATWQTLVSRASVARPGTHMWTAPGLQELWQGGDRIACDHMSGLLMRSHMTAGQDGFRDGSSKQGRGFWSATGSHGVSHVSDRSITPSARLEQAIGLGAR